MPENVSYRSDNPRLVLVCSSYLAVEAHRWCAILDLGHRTTRVIGPPLAYERGGTRLCLYIKLLLCLNRFVSVPGDHSTSLVHTADDAALAAFCHISLSQALQDRISDPEREKNAEIPPCISRKVIELC